MSETVNEILGLKAPTLFKPTKLADLGIDLTVAAPTQVVGLEIETELCQRDITWYTKNLSKIWETKTDGSLRGNAYEFITDPSEISILMPELAEFFKKTGFTDANYTDRCSIHVHTNVQDMTPQQVATLFLIYSVVEDVLFEFVNYYGVADPRGKYRDTNIYCVPWSQCRMNHKMVHNIFNDIESTFKSWQKYTALNIIPAKTLGTVEWRHMHGTADMEKITKWLNLIGSIMEYSKKNEFEKVVDTIKTLNDTSAYRQFYAEVLRDYIPYDAKQEQALAAGIVNAKYALIGLKDYKFRKPEKNLSKSFWEEAAPLAAGAGLDWGAGPGLLQPEAPPTAHEGTPVQRLARQIQEQREQVRAEMNANIQVALDNQLLGGRNARPVAVPANPAPAREPGRRQVRLDGLNATLPRPFERVTYLRAGRGMRGWAVRTANGQVYDIDGRLMTGAQEVRGDALRPNYVEGFGPKFWNTVAADWRPDAAVAQQDEEGEF